MHSSMKPRLSHRAKTYPLRRYLLAGLIILLALSLWNWPEVSDSAELDSLKSFVTAFLGRPPSDEEWREFVAAEEKSPPKDPAAEVRQLNALTEGMLGEPGSPRDLHLRHRVLESIVFDPEVVKSVWGKLFLSHDPVAAVDLRTRQLMTLGDVRAFINLYRFVTSGRDPGQIPQASAEEATRLSAEIRQSLLKEGALSTLHSEAAALWAGLVKHWDDLDNAQQEAAGLYIKRSFEKQPVQLADELRIRLAGWNQEEINLATLKALNRQMETIMLAQQYGIMRDSMMQDNLSVLRTYQNSSYMLYPPPGSDPPPSWLYR